MSDLINGRTPEEIKLHLTNCAHNCTGNCSLFPIDNCVSVMSADALALIERLEAAQPRWISVKERLPEMCDDGSMDAVLVTDGFLIHMAYYVDEEWLFCESGEMKEPMFYAVTHWMPRPEPPKEDA